MDFKNILLDITDHIATVTINRPDKLNALNKQTLEELNTAFESIKNDDSIFVVIITGSGEKAFVAGADIAEINTLDEKSALEFSRFGQSVFNKIEDLSKPVIAAVNGYALGGGCELSLACHIRVAAETAKFGQPEIKLGIIPGYGGTQRLTKLINSGRALAYILSGDMIDSKEAKEIGLVSKVYPLADLMTNVKKFAEKIVSFGQIAVNKNLESVMFASNNNLESGLAVEAENFAHCCGTEDFKEGTSAFLEKRAPHFQNK